MPDTGPHRVNGHNFYDAVNKLVQRSAFDPGVHLHTVRHTTASRLCLSALSDSVDYDRITPQFPWLAGCLSSPAEMDVLLGGEGQSGHGLQAVAALMGHSHPLTTLRHYIHTAGIAFYAHLCGRPVPNLMRAFEFRLGSSRTMQRRIRAWRDASHGMDSAAAEGFIQREVLNEAETLCPGVVNVEEQARACTAVDPPDEARAPEIPVHDADAISYGRLARMEEILRDEAPNDAGLDIPKIEHALARIYAIPTGKHGSSKRRHPHEEVGDRCLPQRLAAKSPTQAAAALCTWVQQLRVSDRDLLDWLLQRWLYASEQEFGRIRLDAGDDDRWRRLPATSVVTPVLEEKVFKRQPGSGRADRTQRWGRIRCGNPTDGYIRRDVLAVRWVLTWSCVLLTKSGDV